MPSILTPCLALLSMAGLGALALRFALGRADGLSRLERAVTAPALGMLAYSLILLFAGAAGMFAYAWVWVLHAAGLAGLAFVLVVSPQRPAMSSAIAVAWLPLALMALLCVALTVGSFLSPLMHPDARQYHLGLPWLMSVSGSLSGNDTLLHNGTYLGYDILYSSVADLKRLGDVPAMADGLKLFNAITSAFFPLSTLLLCRAFGGSWRAGALAALATFTLGPVVYWGFLKNDIVAAGVGLLSLALLANAYEQVKPRMFFVACALAAYAVSIKITNIFPLLLPFAFVCFSRRLPPKARIVGAVIGLVLILPWVIYAYAVSGNPIAPVATPFPEEIRLAAAVRNSNGIEASAYNLVNQFVPIVLGRYPIPGNQSLGILSLLVVPVLLAFLIGDAVKRRVELASVIACSALLWFFVFYASTYDNRFLSRYVLICFAILFSFACFRVEVRLRGYPYKSRIAAYFAGIALVCALVVQNPSLGAAYERLAVLQDAQRIGREKATEAEGYAAPYQVLNRIRKPGEAVGINDHMVLFLEPPLFNLHGMHAVGLNLYAKDADYVKRYLSERSVRYLLFRQGISGGTPAVEQYMAECAQRVQSFSGGRSLYVVKSDCW
ncbi:hypothetical protein M2650_02700 [Luteimonas sp. SX5]|uniref:Glycosyltransferase RgtA/B/C/D-like domain-containing protein n=1 Tax=Luteimonas galliterrae TaxID=2940486 RepID=A0ABT0MFA5_9GAMM|nr:hypothetical protein [Luteimonas galliterrae]MCL1633555.1 hypothetical protein [Luteimonas galliterrae]